MYKILWIIPIFFFVIACDNDSDDFVRVTDDEAAETLDIVSVLNYQQDIVYFEEVEDQLVIFAQFINDADVSATIEDYEVEFDLQPEELDLEGEDTEIYVDNYSLDNLPADPGDEVDYEIQLDDMIYEGSITLSERLDSEFPDTLEAGQPFDIAWEIDQNPQAFYNLFTADTEEDPLAVVWEIPGDDREADFDLSTDFGISPEELIEPSLSLWAVNFDHFAQDNFAIISQDIDFRTYDYQQEDFEDEHLILQYRYITPKLQQADVTEIQSIVK